MKQEDKELLLKDLCARLPYGVVVKDRNGVHTLTPGNTEFTDLFNGKCNIAPYLFPLSSMTKEQKIRCKAIQDMGASYSHHLIDRYNEWHLDYRHLIEKELALDATGLNIY